jgi:hypothetical protein
MNKSNESDIERLLLSGITDYDTYITNQPTKHTSSSNTQPIRRHEVMLGETVDISVDLHPNKQLIVNRSNPKHFINVFNLVSDEKAMELWNQLFSTLYVKSYLSNIMPTGIVSGNTTATTSVIIKTLGSNFASSYDSGGDVDFFMFKTGQVVKQFMNSHTVSMKNVGERRGDAINFKTQIVIDRDPRWLNTDEGQLYLISELFISSEQFENLVVKSLRSDELDLLLTYETSRGYIQSKIYLCSLAIPVSVINPVTVSWSSRLLNNKSYVQLHVNNNHPDYTVVLTDSNMHLLSSKLERYLLPEEAMEQLKGAEELGTEGTAVKKYSKIQELYETFVNKNIFPQEIKPKEQYSITYTICPTDRTVREEKTEEERKLHVTETLSRVSQDTRTSLDVTRRVSQETRISVDRNAPATTMQKRRLQIVGNNMLSEYSTPVTIQYNVAGLDCEFKMEVTSRWTSVKTNLGFQMSVHCPEEVTLLEPFDIELLISNYMKEDCDMTLVSDVNSNSSLISQDGVVDIGVIEVNTSARLKLCFVAVQNGLQQLNQLYCINKKTLQEFIFPFPVYLMVHDHLPQSNNE